MGRKCAYVLPIPTQSFNEMSQSSKFKKVQYFEELLSILTGDCKVEFLKFYFNMKQNSQLLIELNNEIRMDSRLDNIICNVKDCLEVVPRVDKINYLSIIANEFPKGYVNSKGLKCSNTLFFKAKKFSKELKLNLKNKCQLQKLKKDQQVKRSKFGGSRGKNAYRGDMIDSFEFAEEEDEAVEDADIDYAISNSATDSINLPDYTPNLPSSSKYPKELEFSTMKSLEKIWIDDSINDDIRLHTIETDDFDAPTLIEFDESLATTPVCFNRASNSTYLNTSLSPHLNHTNTHDNIESQSIQNKLNTDLCSNDQNPKESTIFVNSQNRG